MSVRCGHHGKAKVNHDTVAEVRACAMRAATVQSVRAVGPGATAAVLRATAPVVTPNSRTYLALGALTARRRADFIVYVADVIDREGLPAAEKALTGLLGMTQGEADELVLKAGNVLADRMEDARLAAQEIDWYAQSGSISDIEARKAAASLPRNPYTPLQARQAGIRAQLRRAARDGVARREAATSR